MEDKYTNIINEIQQEAPLLAAYHRRLPRPSQAYFDKLQDRVICRETIDAQLDLDGYFDRMQDQVWSKVQPQTKVIKMNWLPTLAAIAAVCTLVTAAIFLMIPSNSQEPEIEQFVSNLHDDDLLLLLQEYGSANDILAIQPDVSQDESYQIDEDDLLHLLQDDPDNLIDIY